MFGPIPAPKFAFFLPTTQPLFVCFHPLPKVVLFLAHPRKRTTKRRILRLCGKNRRSAQDMFCSSAAEAGRSRSRALDDKQNLVPLREVSWLHRAWVERSKEEAALRPKPII